MNVQRSYFKKTLILLIAVIMVIAYMPNGTWGGVSTAWADESVTIITTADEFAAMSSDGNYKLGSDITITEPYGSKFTGTFDGDGYTVTLDMNKLQSNNMLPYLVYGGMFSELRGGAIVKNVIIVGNLTSRATYNYMGAIAAQADTTNGDIIIENCRNGATVDNTNVNYSYCTGGIIGCNDNSPNTLTIKNCANVGSVTSKDSSVGGILGNNYGNVEIINCYNTGAISGNNEYAGIIGCLVGTAKVENCYTTGTITAKEGSNNAGYAIVGKKPDGASCTVANCYALTGQGSALAYEGVTVSESSAFKTETEMKEAAFATALGSAFTAKASSYPALSWEMSARITFNITPANAKLTIDNKEYTGSCKIALLANASAYTYNVSCDGYTPQTGNITVTAGQDGKVSADTNPVTVNLEKIAEQWGTATFNLTPSTATIELKDGDYVLTPESDGTYQVVKNKTYTYKVTTTDEGYEDESGNYCLNTDGTQKNISLKKVQSIAVSGEYKNAYTQGESLDKSGTIVTATLEGGGTCTADLDKCTFTGFDSYIAVTGSKQLAITVTYKGVSTTYNVTINEKAMPNDVFNGLKGMAIVEYTHSGDSLSSMTNGEEFVYDDAEGAVKSNSANKDSSDVTVKITIATGIKQAKLTFDYKVSGEQDKNYVYDYMSVNGTEEIGNTDSFTEKSLNVKGGDVITITYHKDGSGYDGSDCIWLKNFQIEGNTTKDSGRTSHSSGGSSSAKVDDKTDEQKKAEEEAKTAEEQAKIAAENAEKAVTGAADTSSKDRSVKTAKGNVKVTFKPGTKTQSYIDEMKALGYTVKYRFYRSTKKSNDYKAMLTKTTKTYINTIGKSGTRYYYKTQIRVYDQTGKLIAKTELKDCKYATRIFG